MFVQKRLNSPPVMVKIVLVILAIGLFLGGTSTIHTMTPPYVQLSIQSLAAQQAATTTDVKQLTNRMNITDSRLEKMDDRISNLTSTGLQRGNTN
jgi:hypothetical protein